MPVQKPRCPHPTVLDMLDVADVDVLTILIDQCSVDSILLTEQQAEAICAIEHQRIRGVLSVSGCVCGGLVSTDLILHRILTRDSFSLPGLHTGW